MAETKLKSWTGTAHEMKWIAQQMRIAGRELRPDIKKFLDENPSNHKMVLVTRTTVEELRH